MPSLNGLRFIDHVAFPVLAKSGHQTLLPDVEGATDWTEALGLVRAPSAIAGLFGEVLSLAGELGAMDRLGLGTEIRPKEETVVRQSLESSFAERREELIGQFNTVGPDIKADVFVLIERLRTGDIDFAAEAQAAIGGISTEIVETTGYLTLLLTECEWQASKIKSESK